MAAHLRAEQDRLAALLHEAEQSGTSPQEAAQRVLRAVHDGTGDWLALLAAALLAVAATAGGRLLAQWGIADAVAYDPTHPDSELSALVSEYVPSLAQSITDTTHSRLSDLFTDVLTAGTVADLRDALTQQYDTWAGDDAQGDGGRAGVIGDSTTVLGWNAGEYDASAQVTTGVPGVSVERTWTATMDAHTRPEHAAADGQTVGLHEAFTVGGETLMYPGSPEGSAWNTINCRCGVGYALAGGGSVDASALGLDDSEE